jgi:DNA/RNA-binding domain of Phe-tRNA-synthetase-like protein
MTTLLELDLDLPDLIVGVVAARGVHPGPSPDPLHRDLEAAVAHVAATDEYPAAPRKKAVRDVLRTRGYKPAGRGKPASEYLAAMARKDHFPVIDVLVEINNLVSLESGLPISVLDAGKFEHGAVLRFGEQGERYVFNPSGQEIDLKGLLVVCDGAVPRGTPIKDSMATKVGPDTDEVLAVIYGSRVTVDAAEMERYCRRFAELLVTHAAAVEFTVAVLP